MRMNFNEFYISNSEGKSNCVIRSFCKMYNKEYDQVFEELCLIAKEIGCTSFNDVAVFEMYMKNHDTDVINCEKDVRIKDLDLDDGSYIVFCWDNKEFYHMIAIIDNVIYDKDDECLDLYPISIYRYNGLKKEINTGSKI